MKSVFFAYFPQRNRLESQPLQRRCLYLFRERGRGYRRATLAKNGSKTWERKQWHRSDFFQNGFDHMLQIIIVPLLLTMNLSFNADAKNSPALLLYMHKKNLLHVWIVRIKSSVKSSIVHTKTIEKNVVIDIFL